MYREKGDVASIPLLKRAIELDPNFARAYVALGVRYGNVSQTGLAATNLRSCHSRSFPATNRFPLLVSKRGAQRQ